MPLRKSRTLLLEKASEQLIRILDLNTLLKNILDFAQKGLDTDRGTVYLVDHENEIIFSKVFLGDEITDFRMSIDKGICGYVAKTGETVFVEDAYQHPYFNPSYDEQSGYTTRTMLNVPISNKSNEVIGVFQMINKHDGFFDDEDANFLHSLANYSAVALEMASMHTAILEAERIESELDIARSIQNNLYPRESPIIEGYEIFGCNICCDKVSGDYYDYFPIEKNEWVIAIGDVSGKGVPASLMMALVQAHLKAQFEYKRPIVEIVEKLNKYLYENSTPEKFITFHLGILDVKNHTYEYVNAGHNPPILITGDRQKELNIGGPILGAVPGLKFKCEKVTLSKNAILFSFTDGVSEVFNKKDEMYGEKRLHSFLQENRDRPLKELFLRLMIEIRDFSHEDLDQDDITVVTLKRT